jgi:hypothetical protein
METIRASEITGPCWTTWHYNIKTILFRNIHDEIIAKLNSGNARYHSAQNISFLHWKDFPRVEGS